MNRCVTKLKKATLYYPWLRKHKVRLTDQSNMGFITNSNVLELIEVPTQIVLELIEVLTSHSEATN
jgi:hypothetical protein